MYTGHTYSKITRTEQKQHHQAHPMGEKTYLEEGGEERELVGRWRI
jgi:hypothetical protein